MVWSKVFGQINTGQQPPTPATTQVEEAAQWPDWPAGSPSRLLLQAPAKQMCAAAGTPTATRPCQLSSPLTPGFHFEKQSLNTVQEKGKGFLHTDVPCTVYNIHLGKVNVHGNAS